VTVAALQVIGFLLADEEFDVITQRALITLQGQDVVRLLVDDFSGDLALAAYGVDGDAGALDDQHVQELGNGDDLVRFLRHLDLTEHQSLPGGEGRDNVDRLARAFLLVRAPAGLAVDGDHLHRDPRIGRYPGHEALLKPLRIEGGEDLAQTVVGGSLVRKRPEPAQQPPPSP
jgi:hypothetical protein